MVWGKSDRRVIGIKRAISGSLCAVRSGLSARRSLATLRCLAELWGFGWGVRGGGGVMEKSQTQGGTILLWQNKSGRAFLRRSTLPFGPSHHPPFTFLILYSTILYSIYPLGWGRLNKKKRVKSDGASPTNARILSLLYSLGKGYRPKRNSLGDVDGAPARNPPRQMFPANYTATHTHTRKTLYSWPTFYFSRILMIAAPEKMAKHLNQLFYYKNKWKI